jgi:hypothetical protein
VRTLGVAGVAGPSMFAIVGVIGSLLPGVTGEVSEAIVGCQASTSGEPSA